MDKITDFESIQTEAVLQNNNSTDKGPLIGVIRLQMGYSHSWSLSLPEDWPLQCSVQPVPRNRYQVSDIR